MLEYRTVTSTISSPMNYCLLLMAVTQIRHNCQRLRLICVEPPRSTRSSSLVTLARPPTSSSLRITDRSFRHASPCLWNQLPSSLRQPHSSPSVFDFPAHAPATSYSLNLPLSPSISPSFLSLPPQDLPVSQIFPTIDSLPSSQD